MVLIFCRACRFALLNIVAGVVYALALPFVALVTAYVYFDARTRGELEPVQPSELPAEIELSRPERRGLEPLLEALSPPLSVVVALDQLDPVVVGIRTKQSSEPPSRTEYGARSGSMPWAASFSSVSVMSSTVSAMCP